MPEITASLMTLEDVDAVHAIEEATFPTPWSHDAFVNEVTENRCARYIVLKEDGVCVAYAGMWLIMDEGHITNIAVRSDRRGLGYGEAVTRALIQLAADSGLSFLTLECRRSNAVAQLRKQRGRADHVSPTAAGGTPRERPVPEKRIVLTAAVSLDCGGAF